MNDSKDTNGQVNDHSLKAEDVENDNGDSQDDKEDEGGADDPAATGGKLNIITGICVRTLRFFSCEKEEEEKAKKEEGCTECG